MTTVPFQYNTDRLVIETVGPSTRTSVLLLLSLSLMFYLLFASHISLFALQRDMLPSSISLFHSFADLHVCFSPVVRAYAMYI